MTIEWEEIPFFELGSEKVFEKVGEWVKDKYEHRVLRKAVEETEEDYKKNVFDYLPHQEEFDWKGLKDFIDAHLLDSISAVFLSPSRDVREALRKQVVDQAYSSARANGIASQRQVNALLKKVMVQVGNFLRRQQEPMDWIPFNKMTDEICVSMDALENQIKEMMEKQAGEFAEQYERLRESLAYQNSFAKWVDGIDLPSEVDSLFHYRDSKVGFYGREKEIAFLDGFLDCGESILFTAVTGPAGAGKSKFLYEYVKGMAGNPNWKCLFFQNKSLLESMKNFGEWQYPMNLLVVIDYAGDYAELIGEWLVSLKMARLQKKMRIVLLEREGLGKLEDGRGGLERISANPMWYDRLLGIHARDDVKSMLYASGKNGMFLELPTLSDDAFKSIISDYGKARGRNVSSRDQEEILAYCKKVEKRGGRESRPRPLILLFITDAWAREEDYRRWNVQELLSRIIERYQNHWREMLCQGNQEAFLALQRLLVYATATGGWKIQSKAADKLQQDFTILKSFCKTQSKMNQLFRSVNEKIEWDDVLSPLEPDLIGELFVLEYLADSFDSAEMVIAFQQNPNYMEFLFRCIVDYADVEGVAHLFDNGLEALLNESLIHKMPMQNAVLLRILICFQKKEKALATIDYLRKFALEGQYGGKEDIVPEYAKGLFNLTAEQELAEAEKTVERLRKLSEEGRYAGNEEIVAEYAKGLFNLTAKQELAEAEKTVECLRKLSEDGRYAGNEEIVAAYAKGLFNLAAKQELTEAEKTVKRLRGLSEDGRYVGNEEIVVVYAKGLFNLTVEQELAEAENTMERLCELAEDNRYVRNEEIVLEYTKGLVNLAAEQELEEAEKTVERLRELSEDGRYAGNEEIVLAYAKGLVNLAAKQELEEAEKTAERLRGLSEDGRYAGNGEIVAEYASGLFNLTAEQELEEAEKTVERLRELSEDGRYAGNEDIVLEYAKGLTNLTAKQKLAEVEKMVERLRELSEDGRYAGNEDIVLAYAKGLFRLAAEQELEEAEKTVKHLRKLSEDGRYAGNEKIMLAYAMGLFRLAAEQELEEAEKTVEHLRKLSEDGRYAGNEEIVLAYAMGLFSLAAEQELTEAEKTVEHLRKLSEDGRYAGNGEIVVEYAKGLVNLAAKQELEEAEKTVERLRGLSEDGRYVGNEKIVLRYAKGLVNLAAEQELEEAEKTVERLRGLSEDGRYVGNGEIVLAYARGLFNLTAEQELEEAEKTVERLRELSEDGRYADNEEIVLAYAKGLVNLVAEQKLEEAEKTVERLRGLSEDGRYAGNEKIVLRYAKGLTNLGLEYYLAYHLEKAEESFTQAHQIGYTDASINLCYMIRRGEAKKHSPEKVKEILQSLLEEKKSFAIMNMALYLAEFEGDWQGADNMIASLHGAGDVSGVIDWWSGLEDLEGLLVMTWLKRHGFCASRYMLREDTLKLLRGSYPGIPDWMVERRGFCQ